MTDTKVIGTGYVKRLFWDQATLAIISETDGKEYESLYRMDVWEFYAARETPAFDLVSVEITADDVADSTALSYNLRSPTNPNGVPSVMFYNLHWKADFDTYKRYLSDEELDAFLRSRDNQTILDPDDFELPIEVDDSDFISTSEHDSDEPLDFDGDDEEDSDLDMHWGYAESRAMHGPDVELDVDGDCDNVRCAICYEQDLDEKN